jgi:DNA-3-methyladenine glycosylase
VGRYPAVAGLPLRREFYSVDSLRLARALLGKVLVHDSAGGVTAGRIVEVEAYRGPEDRAAHSSGGRRTPRNESMWGPAGHAYVYFVYGMHWCLNVVAARAGLPQAVLLRAIEPLAGLGLMRARRGPRAPDDGLARGPANLCKAMGIDRRHDGADLVGGRLTVLDAEPLRAAQVVRTPRIGVGYAGADAMRPWRFFVRGSASVSAPRGGR